MPRLPILKAREVIRALERGGLKKIRQKGSHVFMQHPNGNTTLVPLHSGRDIDRALLQKIIADAGITQETICRFACHLSLFKALGIMAKEQLYKSTQAAVHKAGDDESRNLYFKRGDVLCYLSI